MKVLRAQIWIGIDAIDYNVVKEEVGIFFSLGKVKKGPRLVTVKEFYWLNLICCAFWAELAPRKATKPLFGKKKRENYIVLPRSDQALATCCY